MRRRRARRRRQPARPELECPSSTDITPVAANTDDDRNVIAIRPRTWPKPSRAVSAGQAHPQDTHHRRLLLRLRRARAVHARRRRRWKADAPDRQEGQHSTGGSANPPNRPAPSWPAGPYKLELVGGKSGDAEIMEVGGDELTAYDNLNPTPRSARLGRPVPRTAHPRLTKTHPAFKLTAARPPTGRAIRKRRPAADLAPRGNPGRRSRLGRRDRKLGVEWTCSASPTRNRFRPSGSPTPKGGIVRRNWRTTRWRKLPPGGLPVRQQPAHHQGQLFHLGTSGLARRRHVPHCTSTPRSTTPTARCANPARTTTSSRWALPDALPDLPRARAIPVGTAVAALRVRHGHRLREVRCGARVDQVRGLTMDDAHIFCTRDQMRDELRSLLRLCSTCSPTTASPTSTSNCLRTRRSSSAPGGLEEATTVLAEVGAESELGWCPVRRRGVHGPKISVQVKGALGRTLADVDGRWTNFRNAFRPGVHRRRRNPRRPVMIHRARQVDRAVSRHFSPSTTRGRSRLRWRPCGWSASSPDERRLSGRGCHTTEGAGPRWTPAIGWPKKDRAPHQHKGAVHGVVTSPPAR